MAAGGGQAEQARWQAGDRADLYRQRVALEPQELKDEGECCQLELELLEEEENGLASDSRSHYKTPVLVPSETPCWLRESP